MALIIEKRDITKIAVDAVVNFSNSSLIDEGCCADFVIRQAAGLELSKALSQIGHCEVGSAVITDSFNMPKCKHIIHVARPSDSIHTQEEKQQFENCCFSALDIAVSHHLKSVAFPLFSYGAMAYETARLYQVLVSSIRQWLCRGDDLDVRIVPDPRSRAHLHKMINSGYRYYYQRTAERISHEDAASEFVLEAPHSVFHPEHDYENPYRDFIVAPLLAGNGAPFSTASETGEYSAQDLSFAEMCIWWCRKKNIGKSDFLSRSNITRATFSNILRHPDTIPKKTTVLACAIGLELDLDQTKDLLLRAGMALSRYYTLDRYVSQCILCQQYDIDAINYELFEMDLPLLGYSRKD